MTEPTAPYVVRALAPTVSVIEIEGELTRESEHALNDAYAAAADSARTIILAFDQLTYMNSSGIGLLVALLIRAKRNDQRILAYGLSGHYREIFELTHLDHAITIHDTQDAALAAIA
jgi:anti-sigma B factor antagonist